MDKRDFYREIMEKYAFDKEKIYTNAKSGKYIGSKHRQPYPLYIGMTAAVAAVVVTVSALTATQLGKSPDAVKTLPGDASVTSISESTPQVSDERSSAPISAAAPSDSTAGGTSGYDAPLITDNSTAIAVGSENPWTNSGDTDSTDNTISSVAITDSTDVSSSAVPESSVPLTSTSTGDTSVPADPVAHDYSKNITAVTGIFPTNITVPNDTPPSISIETLVALPSGTELPYNPGRVSYQSDDIGAQQAYFLNDNTVYVRTAEEMRLYTMKDGELVLTASQSCAGAVMFWIAESGGRQLAFDNGRVYDVNAQSGTITENVLNVGGEILDIAYNEDAELLALNVSDNGSYKLIVFENGFSEAKTLYESVSPFTLAAASATIAGLSDASVFFAVSSGDELLIYKAALSGDISVISTLQGEYDVSKNPAFTHAVLDGEIADLIFDPEYFGLIPLNDINILFGVSRHSFLSREGYFTISGGDAAASGGVSVIAPFDFTRSFSQYYLAAAENGAVRVANGVYTKRARLDTLTFDAPEETSSASMRMAVNAAVGVQNALGGGLCESVGIVDTATLDGLIKTCFSEEAGAALKQRCSVGDGESLTYTSGRIGSINLSDTVLVISEETETGASGALYINAGEFGGRTAYYSCAVKLQKTEGGYMTDCIIE